MCAGCAPVFMCMLQVSECRGVKSKLSCVELLILKFLSLRLCLLLWSMFLFLIVAPFLLCDCHCFFLFYLSLCIVFMSL
jgi:hypothetical protein